MNNYVPDCIFPTDNDAEVPMLRLDMQPEFCDIPFVCFGEQKRTFQMNGCGTLHFYTDDYRFSVLYEHPEKILQHNPRNIVEPNFSLFNEMPVAFGLQAIYKKRFIARAMQEKGIRVFVDLNVAAKFYKLTFSAYQQVTHLSVLVATPIGLTILNLSGSLRRTLLATPLLPLLYMEAVRRAKILQNHTAVSTYLLLLR